MLFFKSSDKAPIEQDSNAPDNFLLNKKTENTGGGQEEVTVSPQLAKINNKPAEKGGFLFCQNII